MSRRRHFRAPPCPRPPPPSAAGACSRLAADPVAPREAAAGGVGRGRAGPAPVPRPPRRHGAQLRPPPVSGAAGRQARPGPAGEGGSAGRAAPRRTGSPSAPRPAAAAASGSARPPARSALQPRRPLLYPHSPRGAARRGRGGGGRGGTVAANNGPRAARSGAGRRGQPPPLRKGLGLWPGACAGLPRRPPASVHVRHLPGGCRGLSVSPSAARAGVPALRFRLLCPAGSAARGRGSRSSGAERLLPPGRTGEVLVPAGNCPGEAPGRTQCASPSVFQQMSQCAALLLAGAAERCAVSRAVAVESHAANPAEHRCLLPERGL